MANFFAAYDAAPTPTPVEPVGVFLVAEDGVPTEIAVDDFDFSIESLDSECPRTSKLDLRLVFAPDNPQHRALRVACVTGESVTLQVALRGADGQAIEVQEGICQVTRCSMSVDGDFGRRGGHPDDKQLIASIDLESEGGFRDIV